MAVENVVETDVLVLGGGIAGCCAAIKAREQGLNVTLVDKAYVGKSGTTAAAGMRFSFFNPELGDDYDLTMKLVTEESEYLNNREWTDICIKESWWAYETLASWGVEFPVEDKKEGTFVPKQKVDSPFTAARIVRRGVPPPLRLQAEKSGVKILDKITITDLLKQDGRVVGAVGFPVTGLDSYIFKAKATVLCTGSWSLRCVGAETHNMTGDGQAMAYRAGAELTSGDMHSSHHGSADYPAWRGGRAARAIFRRFIDAEGVVIPYGYETGLEVDLAFHNGRGPIFHDLDAASPEEIERVWQRQQNSDAMESERIGFDPRNRGKHQISGGQDCAVGAGLWPVNTKCSTTLPGLYAAGDCCSIRAAVFGGLPSGTITGSRAGLAAANYALQAEKPIISEAELARVKKIMYAPVERKGGFSPSWVTQLLLNTMVPYYVLLIQHGERLQAALTMVEFFREHFVPKLLAHDSHQLRLAHETKNMVLGSELALRASLFRTESRGSHYREDYPRRDDPTWLAWIKMREEEGKMKLWKEPIPKEWWPDLSKPYKERYPRRFPGEVP